MPDVLDMKRKPAGNHEQGVDPDIVAVANEARRKPFGSRSDPSEPVSIESEPGRLLARPSLDLDESPGSAAPGDDIDFAATDPGAASEDPPALEPQVPAAQHFGVAAAPFPCLPIHLRDNSRARA